MPVDGEPFRAELAAVDADWQITLRRRQEAAHHAGGRSGLLGPMPGAGQGRAALVLADGGLLAAEVVAADKEQADRRLAIRSER